MKRYISILAVTLLLAAALGVSVHAADTVNVTVTIWNGNGNAAVALEALSVADTDNDGKVSVDDVLSAAHDKWYAGGSSAGYRSEESEFGLSLTRLWGDDSGSYGYYVNNQMAMSLADEVKDGDLVAAFVYTDKKNLSDTYAFMELCPDKSDAEEKCFLAQYVGWDENWNPMTAPIVGANVYVDGKDSGVLTDEDGYVRLNIGEAGEHLITVGSKETPYACGICRITVTASEIVSDTDTDTLDTQSDSASNTDARESTSDTPSDTTSADNRTQASDKEHAAQTGDPAMMISLLALCALSAAFALKRHKV